MDNNQRSVLIEVVQSLEHGQPKNDIDLFDEYKLGECTLELPSGLPAGFPVHITYKYNFDQVLEVTAKSLSHRGATAVYDVFSIIKRPTLDEEAVTQAQTDMQGLTVE